MRAISSIPVAALFICSVPHPLPAAGFVVIGADPAAWPRVLGTIGHVPSHAADSRIFVARPGTPSSPNWKAKLTSGCILILESDSPLAESFGFLPTQRNVKASSIVDIHRPNLPIVLEHAIDVPRFDLPENARVFAKERWTGAPLIAGFRQGTGAILWVATDPGKNGHERFPYFLQALTDLGMEAPYQSGNLWAFFDYSYRTRVDLDYFAARWRKTGIGALHVAAWHFYEPDPERDAYLQHLIEACHRNAISVYAWFELPHVSERFWADHPAWREKTAAQQDAQLDWRKLMNLANRDCFQAVSAGVAKMIRRFDWDGVNLAELYFESLEGSANPARFTPMNSDIRAEFQSKHGWDPIQIYGDHNDRASLETFLDFRATLAERMQKEWISEIEKARAFRPDLDLVLTHVDDRFDRGMRDAIGADASRVLPLLKERDFTFLIEDPATVWNLGPSRYREIAARYAPITPRPDRLAIDLNIVDRYQDVYPTKQQTGLELFDLVHVAAAAFPRVALYFENSILPPDLPLLPSAAADVRRVERVGSRTLYDAPHGVGIAWHGPALVDGRPWPAQNDAVLWLPAGTHSVEPGSRSPGTRLLDFNGTLEGAESQTAGSLAFNYRGSCRSVAVLAHKLRRIEIDGAEANVPTLDDSDRHAVLLPRGQHAVMLWVQ